MDIRESLQNTVDFDGAKDSFLALVKVKALGRARATPRAYFLGELRFMYPTLSDRVLRLCKEELVRAGEPVCSCEDGYYYPESIEDIEQARSYLRAKLADLSEKMKKLDEASVRKFGNQLVLI